ncbi:hypothetical protein, partial [Streptomyces goshikiensis]|uniref:hypothetical protein n=1 Tax=Streptomyces goshikiensis TaxID=1942 RepID=UPI0036A31006
DGSTVSASVTFSLVIGASSMIGSYTERFTVPSEQARVDPKHVVEQTRGYRVAGTMLFKAASW